MRILSSWCILVNKSKRDLVLSILQTIVHWVIIAGSLAVYFIVTLAYSSICVTCNPPSNPYWILQSQMADPMFYLVCIIATVVALLPR